MKMVNILAPLYKTGYAAGVKYALEHGFTPEHVIMGSFPLMVLSDEVDPPGKMLLTQYMGVAIICDDDAYSNTIVCLNGYTCEIMEINFNMFMWGVADPDYVHIDEDDEEAAL